MNNHFVNIFMIHSITFECLLYARDFLARWYNILQSGIKCFVMKFKERTKHKRLQKAMFGLALTVVPSRFDDRVGCVQV